MSYVVFMPIYNSGWLRNVTHESDALHLCFGARSQLERIETKKQKVIKQRPAPLAFVKLVCK